MKKQRGTGSRGWFLPGVLLVVSGLLFWNALQVWGETALLNPWVDRSEWVPTNMFYGLDLEEILREAGEAEGVSFIGAMDERSGIELRYAYKAGGAAFECTPQEWWDLSERLVVVLRDHIAANGLQVVGGGGGGRFNFDGGREDGVHWYHLNGNWGEFRFETFSLGVSERDAERERVLVRIWCVESKRLVGNTGEAVASRAGVME